MTERDEDAVKLGRRIETLTFGLTALFVPALWVMWGAGAAGWHWGYWHAWIIENAITTPLYFVALGVGRNVKSLDR